MILCPQCQRRVDETVQAKCPYCAAWLTKTPPQAATAVPPVPPLPTGRTTLGGEVLADPLPAPTAPPAPGLPTHPVLDSKKPGAPLPAAGMNHPDVLAATLLKPEPTLDSNPVLRMLPRSPRLLIAVGGSLAFLICLPFLAWQMRNQVRPAYPIEANLADPNIAAEEILRTVTASDYKRLYFLVAFPGEEGKTRPGAQEFEKGVQESMRIAPQQAAVNQLFRNLSDFSTGPAVIQGDNAQVPTKMNLLVNGVKQPVNGVAYLTRVHKRWLLDFGYRGNTGKEGAALLELFGNLGEVAHTTQPIMVLPPRDERFSSGYRPQPGTTPSAEQPQGNEGSSPISDPNGQIPENPPNGAENLPNNVPPGETSPPQNSPAARRLLETKRPLTAEMPTRLPKRPTMAQAVIPTTKFWPPIL